MLHTVVLSDSCLICKVEQIIGYPLGTWQYYAMGVCSKLCGNSSVSAQRCVAIEPEWRFSSAQGVGRWDKHDATFFPYALVMMSNAPECKNRSSPFFFPSSFAF